MKKYVIAIVIAFSALLGFSVQAAPFSSETAALKSEVTTWDAVQKVQHWRWGSGGHWRWGSHGGGHWRWGSRGVGHWRWGSRGWHGGHWRWGSRGWRGRW